ncbi:MAG TPA: transposase [Candidatus Sulfotelmatobacter sp.]|nr:transposase [Candidatus Sulfotelmatobacter sp.]
MTLYQDKYRIEPARLRGWDYRLRGWYFVTICTQNRACIFGEVSAGEVQLSVMGRIAASELHGLHAHYNNIEVDSFVVMPNHVHAIVMIDGDHGFSPNAKMSPPSRVAAFASPLAGSLSAVIRSYKAGVTRRGRKLGLTQTVWQSRFHDHLLRGDKVISAVREYIRNNPAKWGADKENPFRPHPRLHP